MEVLKKELRSLLIAAKEGLTPAQLEREYLAMIGKPLPACALGFRSTLELVAEMPDVVRVCPYEEGAFILKAIADETTKGIAKLVARQKGTGARKRAAAKADAASPSRNPHNFCQRLRSPVLPVPIITAAPTMAMPPLEPICETESFHLMPGQQPEPVETKAVGLGDGLKQPQDLEQFLLEKLLLIPEIPPDAVQDRNLCGLPPLERRCMVGVSVGFITSPSQFYIHVFSREAPDDLHDMMCEMRYLYSHKLVSDRYIMPKSLVRPGQLCCVMVRNWWYRAIIHRVISSREVQVFCADYGNLAIVQKSRLRFLKSCYLKLPAQAIPCSLARVKPVEGMWSSAATLLFKELCSSNLLVGLVDEYVSGVLHLFLCDTSTKEDVYFHYVLSDRGHANICGENIPSQEFEELNPFALYTQPSGQQECKQ